MSTITQPGEKPAGAVMREMPAADDSKALNAEEERRLFYVAITRAKDFLTIHAKPGWGKDRTPAGLLRDLMSDRSVKGGWTERPAREHTVTIAAGPLQVSAVAKWMLLPPARVYAWLQMFHVALGAGGMWALARVLPTLQLPKLVRLSVAIALAAIGAASTSMCCPICCRVCTSYSQDSPPGTSLEADGPQLSSTCIIFRDLEIESDGAVIAKFETIPNDAGRNLQAQIDSKLAIAFSRPAGHERTFGAPPCRFRLWLRPRDLPARKLPDRCLPAAG